MDATIAKLYVHMINVRYIETDQSFANKSLQVYSDSTVTPVFHDLLSVPGGLRKCHLALRGI